ncbi:hypothetical protein PR202_gb05238 [Eleusine coracana subsp. coracana]|uniref:TF-B3 domain-containing protein n=1 Tax=Eleusine coracana subsp. coracana TaxID=191504 RepID=A0AAV5E6F4_ELECO|nr:hypothetical protein PR202_gb05238 [Eleusine coracana subsp. coracana]
MAGIDLNTVEGEEDEEEEAPPPPPVAAGPAGGSAVCLELWHACAGPVPPLPRKGSAVVYLPQGHLEHIGGDAGAAAVPPHVFCRVVDVDLHADAVTDEVYARVSLAPEGEAEARARAREHGSAARDGEEDAAMKRIARVPHMFCKTLTASDTSTHGGFSVPRRAAEDCFPPLDYSLQRPCQELVAKDLHGTEWKFRHIYRGFSWGKYIALLQHVTNLTRARNATQASHGDTLTTGWSAFVNKKKLVSGDAVLFLRGEDGVLRLGVRRAAQLKNIPPAPALQNQCSGTRNLENVAGAVAMKTIFHIYYNPRHMNSVAASFQVRWDDDIECLRPNRVSPWEIEVMGSVSVSHPCAPNPKRLKPCFPKVNTGTTLPDGSVSSDFAGSARFHKVLQGQELLGFKTRDGTAISASQVVEARNFQYSDEHRSSVNKSNNILGVPRHGVRSPSGIPGFSYHCFGFGESQRFQKVLQGQEVLRPFRGGLSDAGVRTAGMYQPDSTHASGAGYKWHAPQGFDFRQPAKPVLLQASSPSSVLMFPQSSSKTLHFEHEYSCLDKDEGDTYARVGATQDTGRTNQALSLWPHLVSGEVIDECTGAEKLRSPLSDAEHESNNESTVENGCKIFGISLSEKVRSSDEADSCNGNYNSLLLSSNAQMLKPLGSCWATVHEQRPVVGRVVNVSAGDMMI